jgi:hypothetical protein
MKRELSELLQEGYQLEKEFVAALSDEERSAQGTFDRWTARDVIAHNAYWRKHHAEDVLAVLAGKTTAEADETQVNQQVYSCYRDQSWEEIDALVQASLTTMGEAISSVSEADLRRGDFYSWSQGGPLWRAIVSNSYTHPIIHLGEWYIKRGDPARAGNMYQAMTGRLASLDDSPEWQGTIRYNNACSFSLLGDKETAINELRQALQLNPGLTEWSRQDSDLEPIRDEPGYKALYE